MKSYWDGENWLQIVNHSASTKYYFNDKRHRKDRPAIIHYTRNGTIRFQSYFFKEKLIILKNSSIRFFNRYKKLYMNLKY